MADFTYRSDGRAIRINLVDQKRALAASSGENRKALGARIAAVQSTLGGERQRFEGVLYRRVEEGRTLIARRKDPSVTVIATESLIVEGASRTELKELMKQYDMEVKKEGLFGKVLLGPRGDGGAGQDHRERVRKAFACANSAYGSGRVSAAHPNFVRLVEHIERKPARGRASAAAGAPAPWWNHLNAGKPGVRGADASVRAAWTIDRGDPAIRVAVLDEGVDVNHPDLRGSVVAQKDMVDQNPTAMPSGNDAHGTACAGIIVGRGAAYPGITACSLVAVRIAKDDGRGHWIFDDFNTADAIDWAWSDGKSDVLSNSWGGGPPVDAITNAFARARSKGRGGKGSVIAIAAGNSNGPVQYPATIPEILCVGASNEWDERKSPTSRDGETWWGSCFGPGLSLVAPGVHIATTDIAGASGYDKGDYTLTFNGTSSATPHVAAAAALVLSVAPQLTEKQVRDILTGEAAKMLPDGSLDPKRKWNAEMGWGRLDIHAALRRALHP